MKRQHGAALMIMLLILGVMGAFMAIRTLNGLQSARDQITAQALAQAKDALIGYAVTYRDTHPDGLNNLDKPWGYLPCPDTDNDGVAEPNCGSKDVTFIGRLPWKTLGLPPLRDSAGECLWYAVSGRAKNNPNTDAMNWDTLGQLAITEAVTGTTLAAADTHDTPWAVVLAPRGVMGAQTRAGAAGSECGGSNTVADYLDGTDPLYAGVIPSANSTTTLTVSNAESVRVGSNNDQALWITSREIFDRIKKRSDFKIDIDTLLDNVKNELNGLPIASLPAGLPTVLAHVSCPVSDSAQDQKETYARCNWRSNLRLAAPSPPTGLTANGLPCNAVLFFSGARLASQSRATATEQSVIANYLEAPNAALFPASGAYTGTPNFSRTAASADIIRCITGLSAGATQTSFASDMGTFVKVGGASSVTLNTTDKTVALANTAGVGGGCLWSPTSIALAGKVVRVYYDFQFAFADSFARTGTGVDRGNGFSLSLVSGDFASPPTTCGTQARMGVLGAADVWGGNSIVIETDVYKDAARADPAGNHTAIMLDGFLDHAPLAASATINAACNGTATGCSPTPADTFEESPLQTHHQRTDIHTGCNATCTTCNPATHVAATTYARIATWVDCTACSDVSIDIDRSATPPTIQRCVALDPALNTPFFGFTSGFRSGVNQQGVTLKNFVLRSE